MLEHGALTWFCSKTSNFKIGANGPNFSVARVLFLRTGLQRDDFMSGTHYPRVEISTTMIKVGKKFDHS